MDGQAEVQLPPSAPAPWAAPLPAPPSSSITAMPSVIHALCLQSLCGEPRYLSCLTGEWCNSAGLPITDRQSVAFESLRFRALPNQVLKAGEKDEGFDLLTLWEHVSTRRSQM